MDKEEEEEEEERREEGMGGGGGGGRGGDLALLQLGPVAQGAVTAGDAHRVELARAELLVPGGGDETGSRGGAGLTVVDACKVRGREEERERK